MDFFLQTIVGLFQLTKTVLCIGRLPKAAISNDCSRFLNWHFFRITDLIFSPRAWIYNFSLFECHTALKKPDFNLCIGTLRVRIKQKLPLVSIYTHFRIRFSPKLLARFVVAESQSQFSSCRISVNTYFWDYRLCFGVLGDRECKTKV